MPALGHDLPDGIRRRLEAARGRAVRHDARGWRDELRRWHDLSIEIGLGWPNLKHKTEPTSTSNLERQEIWRAPIGQPVAQYVGPNATNLVLPTYVLPAIVVSVDAPDEAVRAAFEDALRRARQADPFPLQKQGRPSPISHKPWGEVFSSWQNQDILPLAEFLAWRFRLDEAKAKHYPDATFARWREKAPGTTALARAALNRAIASLTKLDHEVPAKPLVFDDSDRAFLTELTADFEAEAKAPDADS